MCDFLLVPENRRCFDVGLGRYIAVDVGTAVAIRQTLGSVAVTHVVTVGVNEIACRISRSVVVVFNTGEFVFGAVGAAHFRPCFHVVHVKEGNPLLHVYQLQLVVVACSVCKRNSVACKECVCAGNAALCEVGADSSLVCGLCSRRVVEVFDVTLGQK